MRDETYIMSPKYNTFVWLPPKTGSSTLSWILAYFDFGWYKFNEKNNNYEIFRNDLVHLGHSFKIPPFGNMDLISATRNPYDRMVSYFRMTRLVTEKKSNRNEFELFLQNFFEKEQNSVMFKSAEIYNFKVPNYIIKLENLYQDLIEIPFIKNSKLNDCGILEEMCNKKIKNSFIDGYKDELYTLETKEKVYNHFKKDFELFGYER